MAAIDELTQFLPRLEKGYGLSRNRHAFPSSGVAALPRVTSLDGKGAKSPEFHPIAARQGCGDLLEDGSHDRLHIVLTQMRIVHGQLRDQLTLRHQAFPAA